MSLVTLSKTTGRLLPSAECVRPSPLRDSYIAMVAQGEKAYGDVYSLRYASYLDGGLIQPSRIEAFSDSYDRLGTSLTIIVYQGRKAIASVRVCLMPERTKGISPAADTFPDEVDQLFQGPSDRTSVQVAEINRLVRSPEAVNNQGLVFLLYRLAGVVLLGANVRTILCCVRRNHLSFYKRIRFREQAGPRVYPGLRCPMYLLAGSRMDYNIVRTAYPLLDPGALRLSSFTEFLTGEPIAVSLMGQVRE